MLIVNVMIVLCSITKEIADDQCIQTTKMA